MYTLETHHSKLIILLFVILLATYIALTTFTSYPNEWNQVRVGMLRETANSILNPADWHKKNGAYMLEYRSMLRLWRIDVNFETDKVTATKIYWQDPHQYIIGEIHYMLAEMRLLSR